MPSRIQYRDSAINEGLIFYVDSYNVARGYNIWDAPNTQSIWYDLSGNRGDIDIKSPNIIGKEEGYFIVTGSNPGIGQNDIKIGSNDQVTIEIFFNLTAPVATAAYVLFSYGPSIGVASTSNTSSFFTGFQTATEGGRILYGTTSGDGASIRNFGAVFADNAWQCATVTLGPFNVGIPKLYSKGIFVEASATVQAVPTSSMSSNIVIGRHPNNSTSRPVLLPIKIGSIKVWNRTLTESEILQSYNTTKGRYEL